MTDGFTSPLMGTM